MESKDTLVDKLLCMGCLCVGRSLQKVTDERMKQYYLDALNEIPLCDLPQACPTICWECEALLNKAVSFREQVKDCYRILQSYTNDNLRECFLTDVSRPPRLRVRVSSPIDLPPAGPRDLALVSVKEEMKVDWDDDRDDDLMPTELEDPVPDDDLMPTESEDPVPDVPDEKTEIQNLDECLLIGESQPPRLRVRVSSPIDLPPAGPRDLALVCVKEELVSVKEEMKVDWDDDRDDDLMPTELEDPVPDDDLMPTESEDPVPDVPDEKTEIQAVKNDTKPVVGRESKKARKTEKQVEKILKLKEKTKTKRKLTEAESKIITIELSYEEMLAEREREATREGYVRAPYRCESCLLAFSYSRSHQAHRANKHAPELGDYSCPICKTVIASVDSFTAHYKRHTRRYECSICRKRTQDMKVMQQHYYGAHAISLRQYECNLCGKISNSIDTHRYHKDSHKARVPCPDCDKSFSHRAGLLNHRIAVHELKNAFPCSMCEKVFRWKASLKRHMEKHHAKDKSAPAYCAACGVSFSSVCSFQRHMRNSLKHVSQDQLKFICDHCGRRFADKTKLRDHIEEKHLHKTYQCHICHKVSKNRVGLDQHVRNVHRGRPINKMCHHCGKGFPTKVQLESHIRRHTGERPFICEFCPTTFSQQSNLYKHNRQVHLNIKSKRYPLSKKKGDKPQPAEELQRPAAALHFPPQRGFVM